MNKVLVLCKHCRFTDVFKLMVPFFSVGVQLTLSSCSTSSTCLDWRSLAIKVNKCKYRGPDYHVTGHCVPTELCGHRI